ncbi:MAG: DUF3800 domain-containing protein [Bacillota bacterium]
MLVLIDESGDPGFKLQKGSTPVFVVAMVIFDRFEDAEQAGFLIRELCSRVGHRAEFKFNKCSDDVRDQFFAAVTKCSFRVRALVVLKARIYSTKLRSDTEAFYSYCVKSLMRFDNGTLRKARIKIDGSGDRKFKTALATYLRRHLRDGAVQSIKFADSRRDALIQLADMAAGAIARSYREGDRAQHARWRAMLKRQIDDVWEFG